jgi:hypothetical protein
LLTVGFTLPLFVAIVHDDPTWIAFSFGSAVGAAALFNRTHSQ